MVDQAIEALRPKYCRRLLLAVDCAGVSEARPGQAPGQACRQGRGAGTPGHRGGARRSSASGRLPAGEFRGRRLRRPECAQRDRWIEEAHVAGLTAILRDGQTDQLPPWPKTMRVFACRAQPHHGAQLALLWQVRHPQRAPPAVPTLSCRGQPGGFLARRTGIGREGAPGLMASRSRTWMWILVRVMRVVRNLAGRGLKGIAAVGCGAFLAASSAAAPAAGSAGIGNGARQHPLQAGGALAALSRPPVATGLSSVSCPTTSLCMAVGITGHRIRRSLPLATDIWDGKSWHGLATPAPAHSTGLFAVSCARRTRCMAVGGAHGNHPGTPYPFALSWDGQRWRILAMAPLEGNLRGISCTTPDRCMAVGSPAHETGMAAAQVWDGSTWTALAMPAVPGAASASLSAVSCTAATSCIAVGSYLPTTPGSPTVPLAEAWDGTSWQLLATPSLGVAGNAGLSAVSCATASSCVAAGGQPLTAGQLESQPLAERWDGHSWSVLAAAIPAGAQQSDLTGVSCTSAASCTAVGSVDFDAHVLTEHWDGTSWQLRGGIDPSQDGNSLVGISCAAADGCMAVGGVSVGVGLFTGDSLAEQWDGSRWQVRRSGQIDVLASVSCASAASCMAVGGYVSRSDRAVTLAEAWNGRRWRQRSTVNPLRPGDDLVDVSCASPAFCMAVGPGIAERWNGTRWRRIKAPPGDAVSCFSATRCMAVGGESAAAWNGRRWRSLPVRAHGQFSLSDVSCPAATECIAVGELLSNTSPPQAMAEQWDGSRWRLLAATPIPLLQVSYLNRADCASRSRCMAVGWAGPGVGGLAERWNGRTWRAQTHVGAARYPGLRDVSCPRAVRCMAVGAGGAERWNGRSWRHVKPAGRVVTLFSVSCARPSRCIAVGQIGTLALAERWNGTRWLLLRTRNP